MDCVRPQQNYCSGSMFNNVGSEGITLADLKISGPAVAAKAAWRGCTITFMAVGVTAKLDSNKKYWMDWAGNWRKFVQGGNFNSDPTLTAEEAVAITINPGEGFVCNFGTTTAKITYSGEVMVGADKKMVIARPQQNFVVVNPSASEINLGQIKIAGPAVAAKAAWRGCTITFMAAGVTAKLDANKKYWMDWNGNWRKFVQGGNFNSDPTLTAEEAAAVTIPAGQGFLCNFGTTSATITMPTSL